MPYFIGSFQNKMMRDGMIQPVLPQYRYSGSIATGSGCSSYTEAGISVFFSGYLYNKTGIAEKHNITAGTPGELAWRLYQKTGEASFYEYDGQFTVIVFSGNKTVIYRDFCGAGPAVYYTDEYFASSLGALTGINGFQCSPDVESFACFLHLGYIPAPGTALQGVKKLAGGQLLICSSGQITVSDTLLREDFVKSHGTSSVSFDEAVREYARLHRQSIARRIGNAKSVGSLLSGGYDSVGNIVRLREIYNGPVSTFSIGFKGSRWSELPLTGSISQQYGTQHYEYEIDGSEINEIPRLIDGLDDLFQESGMMLNYLVMKMVKNHSVDVVLGGDGNDEIFGEGAHETAFCYTFGKYRAMWLLKLINRICNTPAFDSKSSLFKLRFRVNSIAGVMQSKSFGFEKKDVEKLIQPPLQYTGWSYFKDFPAKYSSFEDMYLNKNILLDIEQTLRHVIMFKASAMARLFGQHLAFPYLSLEMRQFLQTLPCAYKSDGSAREWRRGKGTSKYVHKAALQGKLLSGIATQGGFTPLPLFFANAGTREKIKHVILQSDIMSSVLNKAYVSGFMTRYDRFSAENNKWYWQQHIEAFRYFNLLVITLWWEKMINKKHGNTLEDFV